MLTNDQLQRLIQNLIERMNRVEANTARQALDNTVLVARIDHAVDALAEATKQIAQRKHDG